MFKHLSLLFDFNLYAQSREGLGLTALEAYTHAVDAVHARDWWAKDASRQAGARLRSVALEPPGRGPAPLGTTTGALGPATDSGNQRDRRRWEQDRRQARRRALRYT